jgi:hypothetical protein
MILNGTNWFDRMEGKIFFLRHSKWLLKPAGNIAIQHILAFKTTEFLNPSQAKAKAKMEKRSTAKCLPSITAPYQNVKK